jgi:hypothetical protein
MVNLFPLLMPPMHLLLDVTEDFIYKSKGLTTTNVSFSQGMPDSMTSNNNSCL